MNHLKQTPAPLTDVQRYITAVNKDIQRSQVIDLTDDSEDGSRAPPVNLIDPEEGTRLKVPGLHAPIKIIAPKVIVHDWASPEGYRQKDVKIQEVTIGSTDKMQFRKFPRFWLQHLTDPYYVDLTHRKIIGKIAAWRDYTMHIIDKITESEAYPFEEGQNQYMFAKVTALAIMDGLQKLKTIPCSIIHFDAMLYTVEGCNTQEAADFIVSMANSDKFQIFFVPSCNPYRYKITTRLMSGTTIMKKVFGKHKPGLEPNELIG